MILKLKRYIQTTVLTFILVTATAVHAAAQENDTEMIAAVEGADMAIYSLYCDEASRDDRMKYAEIFLSGADTSAINGTLARMNSELAGWYEDEKFLFSKAIVYRKQALRIYTGMDSLKRIADTKYCLARLYYKKGEYHNALKYTYDALDDFTALDDKVGSTECYNILGILYHICKDYGKSKSYFNKYAENAKLMNDSVRMVLALNNSAAVRIEKAISYYEQGEFDKKRMQCWLLLENIYGQTGETEKAYDALKTAPTDMMSFWNFSGPRTTSSFNTTGKQYSNSRADGEY